MKIFIYTICFFTLLIGTAFAERHPFFEISHSAKQELADHAATIQVGDPYSKVISALGKPTSEIMAASKQNREPIGKVLKYYAVIWEEDLVNEIHDELVAVYFNTDMKVSSIHIRLNLK